MIDKVYLCIALFNLSTTTMKMSPEGIKTACAQAEHLIETAEAAEISPFVLSSLIWHESRWLPTVTSSAKACGLTQILSKYSAHTCEELKNPTTSITEGASLLSYWYRRKLDINKALECYSSGYSCRSSAYADIVIFKSKLLMKEYFKIQKTGESNE